VRRAAGIGNRAKLNEAKACRLHKAEVTQRERWGWRGETHGRSKGGGSTEWDEKAGRKAGEEWAR